MSTHFTLDFSIAHFATETAGLYPRPGVQNSPKLLDNLSAATQQQHSRSSTGKAKWSSTDFISPPHL